jgi:hypothetical protein
VAHPQIATFARLAKQDQMPERVIYGQPTKLGRTMHAIRYNDVRDEFVVTNPFAQAILTFAGAASGQEAPIRVIQGPKTRLDRVDRVEVDALHGELFVQIDEGEVLVFPVEASGDIAPIRTIAGPDTQLTGASLMSLAVDPVHDLLVVAGRQKLLIFNRNATGNAKPLRVIEGPKTGISRLNDIAVYPARKLVLLTVPGAVHEMEPEHVFVGIWSLDDDGDVPPRFKLSGPQTLLKKPRAVAVNPKNQEIIVVDMRLNAVLTYRLPEIF